MIGHTPFSVIPDLIRDSASLDGAALEVAPAPDQVRGDDNLEIASC
tara:strand:- start:807 stop:944 length:138 start_codon:yes stop_codon:yes gene_type:complete